MPEYPPGTPCWVELSSPDPEASAAFYGEAMGWSASEPGPVEETRGYRIFEQDGKRVGGLMPQMEEGEPTAWATYVSVADADEAIERARAAGGSVVLEPMDVMDIGRIAFFADPTGAVLGVWQAGTFAGADIVGEPNSLAWNEVLTRDPEANKRFYPAVFGWGMRRPGFEPVPESYVVWTLDGREVGGMMEMTDGMFPSDVPAHWGVVFAVADCDAVTTKAREHGATVLMEPTDMPIGRFAAFTDPQGASFSIMQPAPTG